MFFSILFWFYVTIGKKLRRTQRNVIRTFTEITYCKIILTGENSTDILIPTNRSNWQDAEVILKMDSKIVIESSA
jgi:hypothetical protein